MILFRTGSRSAIVRPLAGLLLFSLAYATINYRLLVVSILYRWAANDYESAGVAAAAFAIQGLALLLAILFVPRRLFYLLLALVAVSAFVNITYGDILGDALDLAKTSWLFAETRQAGEAAGLFASAAVIAALKTVLAIILLLAVRTLLRPLALALAARIRLTGSRLWLPLSLVILAPSMVGFGPAAAERNIYAYSATILTAPPPPKREAVAVTPHPGQQVEKIVWLVDESISHAAFSKLMMPGLRKLRPVDFGEAAALGNCSSPANIALRSGVNVRRIDAATDLRRMPTIWGYARKAGYRTMLIDGQVSGAPQNMIIPTERVLIDDYLGAGSGPRTDYKIARMLNAQLRESGKQFIYVVLRGVHFQYSDHYPRGTIPEGRPLNDEYEAAVAYSKLGMFDTLLRGVDRRKVAVVYTSDHGQNLREGAMPHCSKSPTRDEFSVPLVAFLPPDVSRSYSGSAQGGRSASQIFPTTLQLMGYDGAYAQARYDRDLRRPTAHYVWLGRNALPVRRGDAIDVIRSDRFPGL